MPAGSGGVTEQTEPINVHGDAPCAWGGVCDCERRWLQRWTRKTHPQPDIERLRADRIEELLFELATAASIALADEAFTTGNKRRLTRALQDARHFLTAELGR